MEENPTLLFGSPQDDSTPSFQEVDLISIQSRAESPCSWLQRGMEATA
jgi:hypothetical protein